MTNCPEARDKDKRDAKCIWRHDVLSDILLLRGFTFFVTEATAEASSRHLEAAAEKLGEGNIRDTSMTPGPFSGPRGRLVMSTQGLGINKSCFKAL